MPGARPPTASTQRPPRPAHAGGDSSGLTPSSGAAGNTQHALGTTAPSGTAAAGQATVAAGPGRSSANAATRRSVLHFSLREDIVANRGWAVDPQDKFDPSRQTMQEWASGRAQMLLCRQRMAEAVFSASKPGSGSGTTAASIATAGATAATTTVAAGTASSGQGSKTQGSPHGRAESAVRAGVHPPGPEPGYGSSSALPARLSGHIGVLQRYSSGQPYVALQDGSGGVRYPSGQLAVCVSSTHHGTYVWGYSDSTPQRLLAAFSPVGGGCCYYANSGQTRLVCSSRGGTLFTEQGAPQRSWRWGQAVSLSLQLSKYISVRVASRTDITLVFRHPDVKATSSGSENGLSSPGRFHADAVAGEKDSLGERGTGADTVSAAVKLSSGQGSSNSLDAALKTLPEVDESDAPHDAAVPQERPANKVFSINVGLKTPKVWIAEEAGQRQAGPGWREGRGGGGEEGGWMERGGST